MRWTLCVKLQTLSWRHGNVSCGRLVTLIVQGDVSAVTEAVETAAAKAIKKPASYAVIARPHEEIVKLVELSASRWKKQSEEQTEEEAEQPEK